MPTQEQIIAHLRAELEKANKKLNRASSELERKNKELERKNKVIERKDKEIERKDEEIKRRKAHETALIAHNYVSFNNFKKLVIETVNALPADAPEIILNSLKKLIQFLQESASTAQRIPGWSFFSSCTIKKSETTKNLHDEIKNVKKETLKTIEELKKEQLTAHRVLNNLAEAAISAARSNPGDAAVAACADIVQAKNPDALSPDNSELSEENQGSTQGRQVPEAKKDLSNLFEKPFTKKIYCPHCKCVHEVQQLQFGEEYIRFLVNSLNNCLSEGHFRYPIVQCTHCNTVFADRHQDMPVPYSTAPGNQTAANIVIGLGLAMGSGFPLHRMETMIGSNGLQLATEQFARPVAAWVQPAYFGGMLLSRITAQARQAKRIGADETPLHVLENDGKSGGDYLLLRTSVPSADKQFAIFDHIPSRSAEAIAQVLKDWEFEIINRDGYAGYDAVFRRPEFADRKIASQVCLVHVRRAIRKALDEGGFAADIQTCSPKERVRRIHAHAPQYLLWLAMDAFTKIYRWEGVAGKPQLGPDGQPESREAHLKRILKIRQEHCRPLIENIDVLMHALAKDFATQNASGTWASTIKDNAICKAVTDWLNNREDLGYFLSHPEVPADSNHVERCIRAVALYKASAFFKQTADGAQSFCNWLSLLQTAQLNGIKDPFRWLDSYHRAIYEHAESRCLTERYARLEPGKKLALHQHTIDPRYLEDFDFEHWLPWNYARHQPAD